MSRRSKMLILASLATINCIACSSNIGKWQPLEMPPDRTMKVFHGKRTKPKKKKLKYKRKGGRRR